MDLYTILDFLKYAIGIFLFLWFISVMIRQRPALKRWDHNFGEIHVPPSDIYEAIAKKVGWLKVHGCTVSYSTQLEAGIFSARRQYLTIEYKNYSMDICCARFGSGFYLSWWLHMEEQRFAKVPILNTLLGINPEYPTYASIDTATMFQSVVHSTILEVIDEVSNNKGMRLLTDFEREPKSAKA